MDFKKSLKNIVIFNQVDLFDFSKKIKHQAMINVENFSDSVEKL